MNLMKPLAITLLAVLSVNVALANWCGYDPTATLGTANIKSTDVSAMGAALRKAASKCGASTVSPDHSSALSKQLTGWANLCGATPSTAGANVVTALIDISKCGLGYNNLKQPNPTFNNLKYPADYQSYEVSHGPFCDNGTNPANNTNYTNDPVCQCVSGYGSANQSNDGTAHPVNMIGKAPYSWLSASDKATYVSRVKNQATHVMGLGTNPGNQTIYTGEQISQSARECCTIVGGTVNGNICK